MVSGGACGARRISMRALREMFERSTAEAGADLAQEAEKPTYDDWG